MVVKGYADRETELESNIKAMIIRGFHEWNKGYENWMEWCKVLYEPDAKYHILTPDVLTLEQYQASMKLFWDAFDCKLGDLKDIICEGNIAAIRYTQYLYHKAPFMGIPATNKTIEMETMEICHFSDRARLQEGFALGDTMALLQQLGVLPEGRIEGEIKKNVDEIKKESEAKKEVAQSV